MLTNETTHEAFTYTHDFDGDSSFVRHVWYNENSAEMVVGLDPNSWGPDYTEYYHYSDVDQSVYDSFRSSGSRGRFYNANIKSHYASNHLPEKPEPRRLLKSHSVITNTQGEPVALSLHDDHRDRTTYEVLWTWNGHEMPVHVVEGATEDEAVEALRGAVHALGLTGARVIGLRYTAPVHRSLDLEL